MKTLDLRSRRLRRPRFTPWVELLEERSLLTAPAPVPIPPLLQVDPANYDASSVLVRFQPGVVQTGQQLADGIRVGHALSLVDGLYRVELSGVRVEDAVQTLQTRTNVIYAQPNYRVHVWLTPNDPRFAQQYSLNNTGQTGGAADADIDAAEAWDTFTGNSTTVVAVIDTGVDYNHPDLQANIWVNTGETPGNGVDDDKNGFVDDVHGYDFASNDGNPMDDHGHGTHVAGTIGALSNNGVGIAGIAWNVKIMPVKFLDANGSGSLDGAIDAINYAVKNGATISNNSWGGGGYYSALHDAIAAAGAAGHIFVAAAGNDGAPGASYPAAYDLPNIISVAATDHNDQLASFSNYGATTVDLGAPGVSILSTVPTSGPLSDPSGYKLLSGTSMATPHVTGVVALVRGLHPDWDNQQVIDQILNNVDTVSALTGKTVTGGRLNAFKALTTAPPPDTSGPRIVSTTPQSATLGPVASLRVAFNEAIDEATFTIADIASFAGPNGPIEITGVQAVAGTYHRQFDLTFASQSDFGAYAYVLGPDILDMAGNPMNQDQDAANGEASDDQFHGQFTISDVLTFNSSDAPKDLPWGGGMGSILTIDQDVTIGDINVSLDITHPNTFNLSIYIIAPDGRVDFLSIFAGNGPNYSGTTFDDEAAIDISQGAAPFTGSFRPLNPLSFYDGMTARGTWMLVVENWGYQLLGQLNSWSITITPAGNGTPEPPPSPPPSPPPPAPNRPPVAIDDSAVTNEDVPVIVDVLANDSDPDSDPLSVIDVSMFTGGSAVINADNTVTFTPTANFSGPAGFTYTVSDGQATASAFVAVTVNPTNDPPTPANDLVNAYRDTTLTVYPWELTANDIDPDGDPLSVVAVSSPVHGQVELQAGAIVFTPEAGYQGWGSFVYTVSDGQATATARVDVNIRGVTYFSTGSAGTLQGTAGSPVTFTSSDIISLTINADGAYSYQMYFDGSDVGLSAASENIDAFTFLSDGSILVSTTGAVSVPSGSGFTLTGSGEDILRMLPASLGENTSGPWTMYFDGSDVGLGGAAESVDALAVLPDGKLLISTAGAFSVPAVTTGGQAADLLLFTPRTLGNSTTGSWSLYFDGSDVGLSAASENIDGLFVKPSATGGLPTLILTTTGNFSAPGVAGTRADLFAFTPTLTGWTTAGAFNPVLTLPASQYGLGAFNIDGFMLGVAPLQFLAGPVSAGSPGRDAAVKNLVTLGPGSSAGFTDPYQLSSSLRSVLDYYPPIKPAAANAIWDALLTAGEHSNTTVRALLLAGANQEAIDFWDVLEFGPTPGNKKKK